MLGPMNPPHAMIKKIRYAVQAFFLVITGLIGYRFHLFIQQFLVPGAPEAVRPPSVDAFMPISGFMSLKYFVLTGIIEPIHPAAFIMFVAIVGVSLLFKKGFCGWICPIGTISQVLWMVGEKFSGYARVPKLQVDIPLRSVKYLLMGLFIFLIGIAMPPNMMVLFFIADYYKTIDVRTMQFFTQMSLTTMWVLIGLGAFSLFYRNVWCRYLCPYGALLGLASLASPLRIRRNQDKCVNCGACRRNCPSHLPVDKLETVRSAECFGCMTCVASCRAEGALEMTVRTNRGRKAIRPLLFPALMIVVFYLVIGLGMATGNWHSQLDREEYRRVITELYREAP